MMNFWLNKSAQQRDLAHRKSWAPRQFHNTDFWAPQEMVVLELSAHSASSRLNMKLKSLMISESPWINFQLPRISTSCSNMFKSLFHHAARDIDRVHIQPVVAKVFTGLTTILKSKQGSKRLPWEVFHGRTQLCSSWCLFITGYESCLSKCHSRWNWNIPKDLHVLHDYSHFMKHNRISMNFYLLPPKILPQKSPISTNLLPKHVIWSFAASFQDIQLTTEA